MGENTLRNNTGSSVSFSVISQKVAENVNEQRILTGAFLSIGFITNFLSLNEIFRISLQGKPILGVNLKKKKDYCFKFKSGNLTMENTQPSGTG